MSSEETYEWDEAKRVSNLAKHKVDFVDVVAFDWGINITREDDDVDGEQRFVSIAAIYGVLHVLMWTERGEAVRVISLRKAERREIKAFEG